MLFWVGIKKSPLQKDMYNSTEYFKKSNLVWFYQVVKTRSNSMETLLLQWNPLLSNCKDRMIFLLCFFSTSISVLSPSNDAFVVEKKISSVIWNFLKFILGIDQNPCLKIFWVKHIKLYMPKKTGLVKMYRVTSVFFSPFPRISVSLKKV